MTTTQTNPNHIYGTLPNGQPIIENSLEHQIAVRDARAARAAAAVAWAKLLASDPKSAARAFLAATGYDRAAWIAELDMPVLVDFARGAKPELRAAILAASPAGPQLAVAIIPDDQLPAFVCVKRGRLGTSPSATAAAPCDAATAQRLLAIGVAVRQTKGAMFSATGPTTYTRAGWNPAESLMSGAGYEVHAAADWQTRVDADTQLAAQIASGAVVVQPMPAAYSRGRLLERRGAI